MATDEDGRPQEPSKLDIFDPDSDESAIDDEADHEKSVEWLATSRSKRSTAGNRMKSMIANEDPEDDLELLFAEDDNDAGFTDVEDNASDVQMDSSDDDDGEDEQADELEGEKELQREAMEKKQASRKRKAQNHIPKMFRKKVRIDESSAAGSASASAAPSPASTVLRPKKKKSERTSWLPSPADMPTRASKRQTTVMSKEQLHIQMLEREARRKKQLKIMEEKAKKAESMKKPPMTQEERLREAALVEKKNSKSLNRWEEAEKQREEERKKKLAALQNRKLEGPVITFWSGVREWKDGKRALVTEEAKKPRKKRGAVTAAMAASAEEPVAASEVSTPTSGKDGTGANTPAVPGPPSGVSTPTVDTDSPMLERPPPLAKSSGLTAPPLMPSASETRSSVSSFLAMPGGATACEMNGTMQVPGFSSLGPKSNVLAPPNSVQMSSPLSLPPTTPGSGLAKPPLLVPPKQTHTTAFTAAPSPPNPALNVPATATKSPTAQLATLTIPPPPPPPPSTEEKVSFNEESRLPAKESPRKDSPPEDAGVRRLIVLQNFDENAVKDKSVQMQILFNKKMTKLPKPAPPPLCVITNYPARYKDPLTGLPYYNAHAFREIRRLYHGDYHFSGLVGAWIGSGSEAARGVPARFLNPKAERSTPKDPPRLPTPPAPVMSVVAGPAPDPSPLVTPARVTVTPHVLERSQPQFQAHTSVQTLPSVQVSAQAGPQPETPSHIKSHFQPVITPVSSSLDKPSPQASTQAAAPSTHSQFQPTTQAHFQASVSTPPTYHTKTQPTSALAPPPLPASTFQSKVPTRALAPPAPMGQPPVNANRPPSQFQASTSTQMAMPKMPANLQARPPIPTVTRPPIQTAPVSAPTSLATTKVTTPPSTVPPGAQLTPQQATQSTVQAQSRVPGAGLIPTATQIASPQATSQNHVQAAPKSLSSIPATSAGTTTPAARPATTSQPKPQAPLSTSTLTVASVPVSSLFPPQQGLPSDVTKMLSPPQQPQTSTAPPPGSALSSQTPETSHSPSLQGIHSNPPPASVLASPPPQAPLPQTQAPFTTAVFAPVIATTSPGTTPPQATTLTQTPAKVSTPPQAQPLVSPVAPPAPMLPQVPSPSTSSATVFTHSKTTIQNSSAPPSSGSSTTQVTTAPVAVAQPPSVSTVAVAAALEKPPASAAVSAAAVPASAAAAPLADSPKNGVPVNGSGEVDGKVYETEN